MARPNDTGKMTEVVVAGQTIAYTTASYDLVYDTASSDMNDSPTPYTAVTSRYAEGTLEWDGSQMEAHQVFLNADGSQIADVSLRMIDDEKTIRMEQVTLTNLNREFPADGKTSGEVEFRADYWQRE